LKNISILGAGSWGTAIAILLNNNGHKVTLWSIDKEQINTILTNRENKGFLNDVKIPEEIEVTNDNESAIIDKDILVIAVPSKVVRSVCELFKSYIKPNQVIVNLSKGFEDESLLRLSEVIKEVYPQNKFVALTGPSHAEEVSCNLPTTCVSSSSNLEDANYIQDIFMNHTFRVYTNTDLVGVEVGGALKNVVALAAGISDGMGFGDNAKAALMTRGLSEIAHLGVAMGADSNTFNGLTGIGDLIVTCTSMHSRNRRAGILIGKGKTLKEALDEVKMVVEGVSNSKAAYELSKKYNVNMPIVESIYKVLFEDYSAHLAVNNLMTREKKSEKAIEKNMLDGI